MRIRFLPELAMALVLFGTGTSFAQPVKADEAPLEGNWKLVVLAFGEDDFAIVKLVEKNGTTTATAVDVQRAVGLSGVNAAEHKDGTLTVTLSGPVGDVPFRGKLVKEGHDAGRFLGTIKFQGRSFPARLEPTEKSKVGPLQQQSSLRTQYQEIMKTTDPKSRLQKLEEAIKGAHGSPASALFYVELLSTAEAAGLDASKVGDVIKKWMDEARLYGDEWTSDVRMRALNAVASNKSLAKLTVELAQDAEKLVSEDALETKGTIVEMLAKAANTAGMTELAKESDARFAKISQQLDEEYHRKVPPFKPATYEGRKDKRANQVVLMELFTGAQCPPCVAADVAFDALLKTYKPTDFIGLQYHLHIPGPDPLTNRDSLARQEYYGSEVNGTPSTFFNGHSKAAGGGPMGNSNRKYREYRELIDKTLEGAKGATIDVSASRSGDQIKIVASAQVTGNGEKAKGENGQPKRFLRLALTEESIHYVGGNKLRFHHHVVRAFPGGADGTELKDGAGKIDLALNLADVKRDLEKYVSEYAQARKFPANPPEIKLDHLAVVAFVQDDGDKSILHAVSVPVENARP